MTKMCEKRSSPFFRPWSAAESVEEKEEALEDDTRIPVVKHEEDSHNSSSSDENGASENEAPSLRSAAWRPCGRSESSVEADTSRSASVSSEENAKGNDLNFLSNLGLGTVFPRSVVEHAAVSGAYLATREYPVFAPTCSLNYQQQTCLPGTSDGQTFASIEPLNASGQFCYGYPFVHQYSSGMYAPSVEQAVEMLHRQDAVAKQMKKMRPKKFRCDHCGVAFSNNGQLKGHVRIHTGERPFKCDAESCGKSFTRNEELTRHKRIHTGLRPHACIICGKQFGRKDHLKKHMRTHENRDPYRMSASALGMLAFGQALPRGHPLGAYYPI